MVDKKFYPAPQTREHTDDMYAHLEASYSKLAACIGILTQPGYHPNEEYNDFRCAALVLTDYLHRIDHLLSMQQGLEHKEFVDIIASGILAHGLLFMGKETLGNIEENNAARQIQRKAEYDV